MPITHAEPHLDGQDRCMCDNPCCVTPDDSCICTNCTCPDAQTLRARADAIHPA